MSVLRLFRKATFLKTEHVCAAVLGTVWASEEKKRSILDTSYEEVQCTPTLTASKPQKVPEKSKDYKEPKIASPKPTKTPAKPCSSPGSYKPCERKHKDEEVSDANKCLDDAKDKASEQLNDYRKAHSIPVGNLTTAAGSFVSGITKSAALSTGNPGYITLHDFSLLEELAHLNRERIPERVTHAKGAGAFGMFEINEDFSKYCKAVMFGKGKKTNVAVRFSGLCSESGSADTDRDVKGFAVKFFTEEGVWDLVGSNSPVYFIKDPVSFPSLIHALKRNPVTHLKDADMFWDFVSLLPESIHQILLLFSDRGLPDGYRHMNGYGVHAFKLTNKAGEVFYAKFHWKTNQGVRNLTPDQALFLASVEPDYGIRDLYNSIADKRFPTWTLCAQVMPEKDVIETLEKGIDPFDVTSVWSQKNYPLVNVGKLTLNRNPKNYFADIEQLAFSPGHMVQGIECSPDKLLQGRVFAYSDGQRYRLGCNHLQMASNSMPIVKPRTYQRNGENYVDNTDGAPNYYPNSYNGPAEKTGVQETSFPLKEGSISRHYNQLGFTFSFAQAKIFYSEILKEEDQKNLAKNIASHLQRAHKCLQTRMLEVFKGIHENLAKDVQTYLAEFQSKTLSKDGA